MRPVVAGSTAWERVWDPCRDAIYEALGPRGLSCVETENAGRIGFAKYVSMSAYLYRREPVSSQRSGGLKTHPIAWLPCLKYLLIDC